MACNRNFSTTSSSTFVRPVRYMRNSTATSESTPVESRPEPTIHDFILLAFDVAEVEPHRGGHRIGTLIHGPSRLIAQGTSFAVHRLPVSDRCNGYRADSVAAKTPLAYMQPDLDSSSFRTQLRDAYFELQVLSHPPIRNHPNIVELLGISWEPGLHSLSAFVEPRPSDLGSLSGSLIWPLLILEYSQLGTIVDLFEKISDGEGELETLTIETKVNLCLDVARGLQVLHECNIFHSDIKAENVLVFRDPPRLSAKIADFGCAMSLPLSGRKLRGFTPLWAAPEILNGEAVAGEQGDIRKADIYSLGLLIWRILNDGLDPLHSVEGKPPHQIAKFKSNEDLWKMAWQDVKDRSRTYPSTIAAPEMGDADLEKHQREVRTTREAAERIGQVFRASLRQNPRERNLDQMVEELVKIQNCVCHVFEPEAAPSASAKTAQAEAFAKIRLENEFVDIMLESEWAYTENCAKFAFSEFRDPDLANISAYSNLRARLMDLDPTIATQLVMSLEATWETAPGDKKKRILKVLYVYYLEVQNKPEKALDRLVACAREGDYVSQAIAYRLASCLGLELHHARDTTLQWLWNGAIRGSPIAMQDLRNLDEKSYKEAHSALYRKYGGLGIDLLQEFEVTLRMMAMMAKDDSAEDLSYLDDLPLGVVHVVKVPDYPGWPGEILKGIGHGRCDIYSSEKGDFWEPEWKDRPHQTRSPGYFYNSDPEKVMQAVFRIDNSGRMAAASGHYDSVLHYAAGRGFLQLVQFLVEKYHPDINKMNASNETPLLVASRAGHGQVVEYLLQQGADATILSVSEETPLHWIGRCDRKMVPSLVKHLVAKGSSLAQVAEYPGHIQRARRLPIQILAYRERGNPLQWHVHEDDVETVTTMLQHVGKASSDVSAVSLAARLAAELHFHRCLEVLIRRVHAQGRLDHGSVDDLMLAATSSMEGRLFHILRSGKHQEANFKSTISILARHGARPLGSESEERTKLLAKSALLNTITFATNTSLRPLLEAGWAAENKIDWTVTGPIHLAAFHGSVEMLDLLVEFGFDPLATVDYLGTGKATWNAFSFCADGRNPNVEFAKRLKALGVPYLETEDTSPFETSVRRGQFPLAAFFLAECGADINRLVKPPAAYGITAGWDNSRMCGRRKPGTMAVWSDDVEHVTLLGLLIAENSIRCIPAIRFLLRGNLNDDDALPKAEFFVCHSPVKVTALHFAAGLMGQAYDHVTPHLFPLLLEAFPDLQFAETTTTATGSRFAMEHTPLVWATKATNYSAVDLLLRHGATKQLDNALWIVSFLLPRYIDGAVQHVDLSDRDWWQGGISRLKRIFLRLREVLDDESLPVVAGEKDRRSETVDEIDAFAKLTLEEMSERKKKHDRSLREMAMRHRRG